MRVGVDRFSGKVLTGWAHCAQSITTIATTAIGTRVMRRNFGSAAPALQDRPQSPPSLMLHFSAIAEALRKWEPGFRLRQIGVTRLGADGAAAFEMNGDFYPNGHLGDFSLVEPMKTVAAPVGAWA